MSEEFEPGYCYSQTKHNIERTEKYADPAVVGIGTNDGSLAMSGFVLAYIDQEYEPGTLLTTTPFGTLTMSNFKTPGTLIAKYLKPEPEEYWEGEKVNGRHWVKIL